MGWYRLTSFFTLKATEGIEGNISATLTLTRTVLKRRVRGVTEDLSHRRAEKKDGFTRPLQKYVDEALV